VRFLARAVAVTLGTILVAGAAAAQSRPVRLGGHLGYDFDSDHFALGPQATIPLTRRLDFYPSLDFYFIDPGSLWALNADLRYRVPGVRPEWLYLGTGLDIRTRSFRGSSESRAGINLIVGAESRKGPVQPFGEARVTLRDGSIFQLTGGLNFPLGRR